MWGQRLLLTENCGGGRGAVWGRQFPSCPCAGGQEDWGQAWGCRGGKLGFLTQKPPPLCGQSRRAERS